MSVSRENILAAVQAAQVNLDVARLRDDVKLSDQGIDSLEILLVLLVLQEKYNIEIPDADVDRLLTINAFVEYLNQRLA